MARWRLTSAHYLNVPERDGQKSEWEQRETSRETGRQVRKLYPVPLLLDPKEPTDFNYPGEIIVAHGDKLHHPRDLIFLGPPTPDMEPLDDEAEAITKETSKKWVHPIESLSGNYGEGIMAIFERQLQEIIRNSGGIPKAESVNLGGVPADAFAKMQEQINELVAKNAELERRIAQGEDDNEPLPPPEIEPVVAARRV